MKKIIMTLAIMIGVFGSTFANDEKVSPKALEAFKSEFAAAKEVTWSTGSNYYKAEFVFNNQHVNAYYSSEGELLGLTRYITLLDLPLNLQATLKNTYSDYWISDLFEVTKSDSTGYYITLENADTVIVMKATADDSWSVFKKVKKV